MTKYKILEILRKSKSFMSGEEISKILEISRTAVWKGIKSLREKGYDIQGVNNKGYKLEINKSDIISEYELKKVLSQKKIYKNLYYFKNIDSTNKYALENTSLFKHGDLIIADQQSAGKGRGNQYFYSPQELGIYLSIVLKKDVFYDSLKLLSIGVIVAVCNAIERSLQISTTISWNQIQIDGKKVGGILTESIFEGETGDIEITVLGIGINVNNTVFPEKGKAKMTSLKLETKKDIISRKDLIKNILDEVQNYVLERRYLLKRKEILEQYLERTNLKNKKVEIKLSDRKISGEILGMSEKGGFIVLKENGKKEIIYKGVFLDV